MNERNLEEREERAETQSGYFCPSRQPTGLPCLPFFSRLLSFRYTISPSASALSFPFSHPSSFYFSFSTASLPSMLKHYMARVRTDIQRKSCCNKTFRVAIALVWEGRERERERERLPEKRYAKSCMRMPKHSIAKREKISYISLSLFHISLRRFHIFRDFTYRKI